jgi:hypothetical protein
MSFKLWWREISIEERESITRVVDQLEIFGPNPDYPLSSSLSQSRHGRKMRELRIQHKGRPYRVFYAFDPRRCAALLIGGDKTGDEQFYERMVPLADRIYDRYLEDLRAEGLIPE